MAFDIPLFDLNYGQPELDAVTRTLESKWISMGPQVKALEARFEQSAPGSTAIAVTNCTSALHLAMVLADLGPGDEVIVPSLTFVATVNAVRYVGATPVFADIVGPHDFSLDPDDVARKITPRTRAIVPMHYAGFACDMGRLVALAREHGLKVIEDAAHAPVGELDGRPLGAIGDFGCYSFFSNKNITCAEGGLLSCADPQGGARGRLMRSHGMTTMSFDRAAGHATSYDVVELGFNYRLDDIRGSLILTQLERLDHDVERRAALRARYLDGLRSVDGLILPYADRQKRCSNYIFPVVLEAGGAERRDAVRGALAAAGIQTSVHYPAVHRFAIYGGGEVSLPRTEHAADHELTLPLFTTMSDEQVDLVVTTLAEVLDA